MTDVRTRVSRVARGVRLCADDLGPALLFVTLVAFACITPAQNDTWWHLRSGQAMWETGSFLTTERFSFTSFGAPLQNHWWLSQLVFYGIYTAGGPFLLTLFAGTCALAACYGSWRLIHGAPVIRVVLLSFLVVATAPEWSVRPQVISLAFLVLCAQLIVRERTAWLPIVCLIWGNTHGMVIFGVLMAWVCTFEALIWTRHRFPRDLAIAVACALAPMLSPIGWEYWPRVLATISMSRGLELQEYRSPTDLASLPFWFAVAAMAALAFRQRQLLGGYARADRVLLIGAAGLALAAASASRNIAFFAVIAAPVLSRLLEAASASLRQTRDRPAGVPAYVMLGVAMVVATAGVEARWRDDGAQLGWRPIPELVLRAVESCPEPAFNHLEDGGYLMWSLHDRRVFVDSRMEAYPLALLRRSRSADLDGEYEQLFRDYGIKCAVVISGSPLHRRLAEDPTMTTSFADSSRTVFVRASAR